MISSYRRAILIAAGTAILTAGWAMPRAAHAEDEEEGRSAPARQTVDSSMELDANLRTAAAEQKRDEAIEQLRNIIRRFDAGVQRSELLFQLAELWIEKSKYVYLQVEYPDYERRYQEYLDCVDTQGFDACGEAPVVEERESRVYLDEALRLYEQILKDSPLYPRKDEVLFSLAHNLYRRSQADQPKALEHYRDLVTQYPNSRFAGDAYVAMGDHYFDNNDLFRAQAAFSAALPVSINEPRVYNYALYKLAWCDYNSGDYEASLDKLKQVVDRSEMGRTSNELGLKEEALRDMVRTWAKLEAVEEANEYYKSKTNRAGARRWFANLANLYFSDAMHDLAIRTYRILVEEDPNDPRNPSYQSNIVRAYEGLRQRDRVLDEMKVLVDNYKPGSAWAVANRENESALASAYNLTEAAMRELVTDYHQEAQRTKEVQTYRLAAQIYKDYLDSFHDSEFAYNLRYYYADILWTLEEWELAAEQYELVYEMNPEGPYAINSAYNTLLTYEKLIAIEKGELQRSQLRDDQKVDEGADRGAPTRSKRVTSSDFQGGLEAEEITQWEQKMIAACDRYADIAANDPRLSKGQDEIQVRYKAAFIYYDRKHFTEAARRFGDIILKWPEDRQARVAADLSLNILEVQEEWYELARLSRAFYENPRLARPGQKWTQDLARIMEAAQYNYIDKVVYQEEKRNEEAAQMFRAFVDEFPKSEFAPRALLYAMTIYREAKKLDEGIVTGEQLLAAYPENEFRPQALLWLAGFYRETANFPQAIHYFETYTREWEEKVGIRPDPKATGRAAQQVKNPVEVVRAHPEAALEAANALVNAARWSEGLGEVEKAVALYRDFIAKYATVPDAIPASGVALEIGIIYENAGDYEAAERAFDDFIRNFQGKASAGEIIFARYHRAQALDKLGKTRDALRVYEAVMSDYGNLSESQRSQIQYLDAYAHAAFRLLEPKWRAYRNIRFDSVRTLQRQLQAKLKQTPELEAEYTRVLEIGSADWGIAALTRIGMMYQDFARNLLDSPDPPELNEDQLIMYRTELEDLAFPLEDKAIEAYELALDRSYDLGVYNEYTLHAQNELNRFRPGEYGEVREVVYTGSEFFSGASLAASLSTSFDSVLEAKAESGDEADVEASESEEEGEDEGEETPAEPAPAQDRRGILILDKAAAN